MDGRAQALAEIARLVRAHDLTLEDLSSVLAQTSGQPAAPPVGPRGGRVLTRVLGFLGGTFVFAGVGVFIGLQWDAMNSAARVIATLGVGLVAFALGALARRDPRFERAATPFYLVAAVLEPVGMFVTFSEYGSGGDWRLANLVTAGMMAAQFGLAFAIARRSMLLFIGLSYATVALATGLDLLELDGNVVAITVGATLLLVATWADRVGHGSVTPLWFFVGGVASLAGLFDLVESSPLEVVFVAGAAAFVYLSVLLHSRTLLAVATLAILCYTGYFTAEHFADSIGWPLALVAFGLFMIGLSVLAVRIDRRYVRR